MTTETKKPESIETQVAEWSATDAGLRAAVDATAGISIAKHAEGPAKGYKAARRPDIEKAREWAAAWTSARPGLPEIADKSIEMAMLKAARDVDDILAAVV